MFGQHKQTNKQKFPMKKPLALNSNLYEGKIFKEMPKIQLSAISLTHAVSLEPDL